MRRIWVIFALQSVFYACIVIRLFWVQIWTGQTYKTQAAGQHYFEFLIPSSRGKIQSADGSSLVLNDSVYLVYAQPNEINDKTSFIDGLSGVLPLDRDELNARINQPGRVWVPLAHKVSAQTVDRLKGLQLKGIGFERDFKRFYPEASMAAHILGFVGADDQGADKGYFGIEGYYDKELRGTDGVLRQEKDAQGMPIIVGEMKRFDPIDGRTLRLWMDRTVQRITETRLQEGIKKYGAKSGSIVIMDPKTGGILSMATFPFYDPDSYQHFDQNLYRNPIIADSFEPGSIFKVLVMSAGIEEKLVSPKTEINESGPVSIGEYQIRTWDDTYRGRTTMTDVLVHSSNVGMVYVGNKLGQDKLYDYITAFGFGNPTGVDLQEETTPDLRPSDQWKPIDVATATFGQGIAVTPIQMVRAVGVLANDGWLMEPHAVRQILDTNGKIYDVKPKKIRQVLSPATSRIITEMMIAAVDYGEAKWAKPKGYRIAGKTGTAQIPVEGHYDEKRTIASFVGFAPADDPKFVMLVTLREPTTSPWGSETAAPLFFKIATDLMEYYNITPD